MSTKSENQEPAEPQTTKAAAPEPSDGEAATSGEAPDFRETAERGYGWGV